MVEIPETNKCCCCIPLRRGLLAWVYFKLVVYALVYSAAVIPLTILAHQYVAYIEDFMFAFIVLLHLGFILEMFFDLLLLISLHKKNFKYLRTYYRYQLFLLGIDVAMFLIYSVIVTVLIANEILILLGIGVVVVFAIAATRIYFIYLLRSELRKLELSAQFTFKNIPDDPEYSLDIL